MGEYLLAVLVCWVLLMGLTIFLKWVVSNQHFIERLIGLETIELPKWELDYIQELIRMRVETFITIRCVHPGGNYLKIALNDLRCESVRPSYLIEALDEMDLHDLIELFDVNDKYLLLELNERRLEYAIEQKLSRFRMER